MFPFDRPYLDFYHRCYKVRRAADAFLRHQQEDSAVRNALERMARILDPVIAEVPFARTATKLVNRATLFDELRKTLRLVPERAASDLPATRKVQTLEQAATELNDIKLGLDAFIESLARRRPERGPAEDARQAIDLILDHLDRHGDSLWGHVVPLPTECGGGVRIVDRTNNQEESFFHRMKHAERRRSGRKVLTADFEALPPAAALAYNLRHPDYVQAVCGSLEKLAATFAQLDQERLAAPGAAQTVNPAPNATVPVVASASLPRPDRVLVRTASLARRITAAAKSRSPRVPLRATGS